MNIKYFDDLNNDIVSINFVIMVGLKSLYKGKINSFAHLIEHLLFCGHPKFSQYELMLQLEKKGALVNASTNDYYTELYIRVQKEYVEEIIELLYTTIQAFNIENDDYEREKHIISIEEEGYNELYYGEELNELFYNQGRSDIPTYDELINIYNDIYRNWSLIIMGKIDERTKLKIIKKYGGYEKNKQELDNLMFSKLKSKEYCLNVDKNGKKMMVYGIQCKENIDIITMFMIKYIYVKGLSSLLYDKLVAENEFCYDIAFKINIIKSNYFVLELIYREDCFESVKNIIKNTFEKNTFYKIDNEEFQRARNMIITEGLLKRERVSAVLNDRIENNMFNHAITLTDEKIEKLRKLSIDELKSMVYNALFD